MLNEPVKHKEKLKTFPFFPIANQHRTTTTFDDTTFSILKFFLHFQRRREFLLFSINFLSRWNFPYFHFPILCAIFCSCSWRFSVFHLLPMPPSSWFVGVFHCLQKNISDIEFWILNPRWISKKIKSIF